MSSQGKNRKPDVDTKKDSGKSTGERSTGALPTVNALKQKAEGIRKAQLDMTFKKLRGLTEEQRSSLEAMTRELVEELIGEPIECIHNGGNDDEDYTRLVQQIFNLDLEEAE